MLTSKKPVIHPLESVVGVDIMTALARFRLLHTPQLLAVTGRDEKTVRGRLNQLVTGKYVHCREFRFGDAVGRFPNIYSLTKKGADWLESTMGLDASAADVQKISIYQAPHRALVLDTMIAADAWARASRQSAPVFRTYMEGRASRLELPTKTADADAIIELFDTQGRRRIYVVEVYCDYRDNATSKPYDQLAPYITAGVSSALDTAVGIPPNQGEKSALVLTVCDSPKMLERVLRGLTKRQGLPPLTMKTWQRFLFKSADELADFGRGWHRVNGERVDLPT